MLDMDTDSSEEERDSYFEEDFMDRKKKHICPHSNCNASFDRPNKLRSHLFTHDGIRPFICDYKGCDKAYTRSQHLVRHKESHNNFTTKLQCPKCSMSISNLTNLKRHYKRVHEKESNSLYCKECKLSFKKINCYNEHIASHENIILYTCEICQVRCQSAAGLKKHNRIHKTKTPKRKFYCKKRGCKRVFEDENQLRAHRQDVHVSVAISSQERQEIICPYDNCGRIFLFKRNYTAHKHTKHLGKTFTCDICNKNLCSKQKLQQHISKIHENNQPKIKRPTVRNKRKDQGLPVQSFLTKLSGFQLKPTIEKEIMKREGIVDRNEEYHDLNVVLKEMATPTN